VACDARTRAAFGASMAGFPTAMWTADTPPPGPLLAHSCYANAEERGSAQGERHAQRGDGYPTRPVGRPTTLTPELQDQIVALARAVGGG
jgi:hypothetical protein